MLFTILYLYYYVIFLFFLFLLVLLLWVNDFGLENSFGFTRTEQVSLIYGIKLLILSELMLFFMCFWGLINFRLISNAFSVFFFYPLLSSYSFAIPYSNLMILLFSSLPIQAAQVFVKLGFLSSTIEEVSQSISCGIVFLCLQWKEFLYSWISLSDCMIGSVFYFTTGLHGLHVFLGLIVFYFILVSMVQFQCYYRIESVKIGSFPLSFSSLYLIEFSLSFFHSSR